MPYLTDAELTHQLALRTEKKPQGDDSNAAVEVAALALSPLPMLGGMTAAGVVGFLRSKFGNATTGEWKLPGTKFDAQAVLTGALAGVAFFGKHIGVDPEWRGLAAMSAFGIGSHYLGELGAHYGRTGQLGWTVGEGVPPYDTTSWDPTQHGDTHSDPQARGLSMSGV